jgi:adenosylcobinamide amidohydrolase
VPSSPPPRPAATAPSTTRPALLHREEDGATWPFLVWRFDQAQRMISSAPVGGGIGERDWILNAQVRSGYDRYDLGAHIDELATLATLAPGSGVGMLTAADVTGAVPADDGDALVLASVGVRVPTWAAAPAEATDPVITAARARLGAGPVGTINIVVSLPVAMSDAALVNLVATATEAKTQALLDAGIAGTGTATDAVCVACPRADGQPLEPFGGPRSSWGARVARATHASVLAGIDTSLGIIGSDGQLAEDAP